MKRKLRPRDLRNNPGGRGNARMQQSSAKHLLDMSSREYDYEALPEQRYGSSPVRDGTESSPNSYQPPAQPPQTLQQQQAAAKKLTNRYSKAHHHPKARAYFQTENFELSNMNIARRRSSARFMAPQQSYRRRSRSMSAVWSELANKSNKMDERWGFFFWVLTWPPVPFEYSGF